ncbi:MAG TPA: flap endonuclease-1 [Candidatus Desulfofervidus auxilii]|uniref:Flap endonuclease-1 n=1 Tax=Desulfofervidus auxilii TaxID=1621989 RepID=A0A7V0I9H4_DESA2|nr:MAG: flap endonuclease-1 [Candidatus Aenigmarchaeota archaeon]HDD35185.1 flap endonuclease-1 [Candidatus Desulfofervidus auxilii]
MGVNLADIVPCSKIKVSDLNGKIIAIDAFNTIYQFLSIIRDRFTGECLRDSSGRITSHISGLFYRTAKLLEEGITPVFVFDGEPPSFKQKTQEERHMIKEKASIMLEKAREEGDTEKIRMYAQATAKLTESMVEDAKTLLKYMGVLCIDAPSEGEAQAAYIAKKGIAYASASQDWDSLLFGTPRLIRNLALTGKRKLPRKEVYVEVVPEMAELNTILSTLSITHDQLIALSILIGTDYNPGGVKGIGPKKALEIVKKCGDIEKIFNQVEWDFDVSAMDIFNFFKNPPVIDCDITKTQPDFDSLKEFMLQHDFSEERVDKVINALESLKGERQEDLSKWFAKK